MRTARIVGCNARDPADLVMLDNRLAYQRIHYQYPVCIRMILDIPMMMYDA